MYYVGSPCFFLPRKTRSTRAVWPVRSWGSGIQGESGNVGAAGQDGQSIVGPQGEVGPSGASGSPAKPCSVAETSGGASVTCNGNSVYVNNGYAGVIAGPSRPVWPAGHRNWTGRPKWRGGGLTNGRKALCRLNVSIPRIWPTYRRRALRGLLGTAQRRQHQPGFLGPAGPWRVREHKRYWVLIYG